MPGGAESGYVDADREPCKVLVEKVERGDGGVGMSVGPEVGEEVIDVAQGEVVGAGLRDQLVQQQLGQSIHRSERSTEEGYDGFCTVVRFFPFGKMYADGKVLPLARDHG